MISLVLCCPSPSAVITNLASGNNSIKAGKAISVACVVYNGTTVNDLVFKPMLRLASDPDNTYQPYAMTNKELTDNVFFKRILSSADDLNDIKTTGIYGTTHRSETVDLTKTKGQSTEKRLI